MKKITFKYLALFVIAALSFNSCSTDDKTIDKVFQEVQTGAFMRITDVQGSVIDLNDPSSLFSITLEFDGQDVSMLESLVYGVSFTGANSVGSAIIGSVDASSFSPSSFGVPATTISFTYGDALAALGIQATDVTPTDALVVTWTVNLTDGRSFGPGDANGNVSAIGGFYSSPYKYSTAFKCGLTSTAGLFEGDFEVTLDQWADYAEGDLITVEPDANDPMSFRILSTANPYIENTDTSYMLVHIDDADGNVTVTSNEDFSYIGWVSVGVTGTGTVNTCTGEIKIKLCFGPYCTYNFELVKA